MIPQSLPEHRPTLEAVQEQFKIWRADRNRGRRIPQDLWSAAIKLCENHSVSKVATALRLNHTDLRDRAKPPEPVKSHEESSAFIELSIPPNKAVTGEWMLELEDPRGRKMRLSWKGGSDPDVSSLAKGFWDMPG